ncbi:MAG: GNAT family N-acetyltransferase [Candidatus Sabulitectum sp.]|nr:GNAT family N-acetyltransferase [Candidatus Sabulitectum sp.]
MMNKEIVIRRLSSSDSLEELTALLHRSYRCLLDLGFRYVASYQDMKRTKRRLDKGDTFVAVYKGLITGTITLRRMDSTSGSPWYKRDDVTSFGQFAVDPDFQGRGIGTALLNTVEEAARTWKVREIALDTAEGAKHLRLFYERRGYRFIEFVNWSVTNYRSVILSKTLSTEE